jgi:anti-sigma regulatory factor (Ser/Thr protein kinase)
MRQVLGDTLRRIGVNEDSVADILLAATEACTNVVLHAGHSVPAYEVAATIGSAVCRVEVTDAGRGWEALCESADALAEEGRGCLAKAGREYLAEAGPGYFAEAGHGHEPGRGCSEPPGEPNGGALTESGRGFAIMRACVDDVTLRSSPGRGTRVVLDKRIRRETPLLQLA